MISWFTDWIYSVVYSGPARNAPNDGINIKKYIEEKPPNIKTITPDELTSIIVKLHKIEPNSHKPTPYISPIMNEFQTVFNIGCLNYLEQKRKSRTHQP